MKSDDLLSEILRRQFLAESRLRELIALVREKGDDAIRFGSGDPAVMSEREEAVNRILFAFEHLVQTWNKEDGL